MRVLFIAILVFGLFSCENPEPEKSPKLIQEALQARLDKYARNKRNNCYNSLMSDAQKLVDSLVAEQLNLDTIDFPRRPIKPNSPGLKEIPKDLELKPIK